MRYAVLIIGFSPLGAWKNMNEVSEESTNIIKVQFNPARVEVSHDIAHPESKRFPLEEELDSDPLEDVLGEFDHLSLDDIRGRQKEDYIFHLENVDDVNLHMDENLQVMSDKLLQQITRVNEGFKRIKYYLDEMNIDD